jgi:hypothetical protein
MTFQPGANLYTQGFGNRPENVEVPHLETRGPNTSDYLFYPIGKRWIDTLAGNEYSLTSIPIINGIPSANWAFLGSSSGDLNSLTTQDSTVVTPSEGTIDLSGSGSLTTTGSGNTATISLTGLTNHAVLVGAGTDTITKLAVGATGQTLMGATGADPGWTGSPSFSGAVTAGTGITSTTGNITATAGNLISTAGNLQLNGATNSVKINATTQSTAAVGFVTLSGMATTTLTSSAITANSIILFSLKTLGTLTASAITYTTAGGSATITPAGSTDTSTYGYLIIN